MTDPHREYAEDIPGLDLYPRAVEAWLDTQRAFWRQIRGDDPPQQPAGSTL
ncbi:hypothetical protein GCM10027169_16600 [Gordonia jinhuaensis]|uniref:Uncharacterized protein n=1 Tax=Gordonia jinhuaensis TaxID=1517702 RepID=A0A916X0S3_9ACTN|nr:hypothetical protein [Gordonia jinhuaensis]GGB48182.1 hypothetical protein GCM10011489_39150 [Gordonia jinhuaensis]